MDKSVFWKAGILTVVIFLIGIQIGMWIDSARIEEVKYVITSTDMLFNDARLQAQYYEFYSNKSTSDFCEKAVDSNLKYNDKIYKEGRGLEQYEAANKLGPGLAMERNQYALLQLQFWMNSMKIKNMCNSTYDVVLHLWRYDTKNFSDVEIPQKLQSAVLLDLKEKCGNKIMLSNFPIDLNQTSVDLIVKNFNITKVPAIVINDNIVLQGLQTTEDLQKYITCD